VIFAKQKSVRLASVAVSVETDTHICIILSRHINYHANVCVVLQSAATPSRLMHSFWHSVGGNGIGILVISLPGWHTACRIEGYMHARTTVQI